MQEPSYNQYKGLPPTHVVQRIYGAWYRLADLQQLQRTGARVEGGLSGLIHVASLEWMLAEESLMALAKTDPQNAAVVSESLRLSHEQILQDLARRASQSLGEV